MQEYSIQTCCIVAEGGEGTGCEGTVVDRGAVGAAAVVDRGAVGSAGRVRRILSYGRLRTSTLKS